MIREIVWRLREPPQKVTYTLKKLWAELLNSGGVEESVEEATVCMNPRGIGEPPSAAR